jgi:DNA-binding IclR family transcriptional regulator
MESTVLVKAFALIESLAGAGGTASLAELAAVTAQAKPTTHRVLRALAALGYVEQSTDDGEYRLTSKLRQLALGSADRDLAAVAQPILQRLRDQTGETVNLGVLREGGISYLTVIESSHALRRVTGEPQHGRSRPYDGVGSRDRVAARAYGARTADARPDDSKVHAPHRDRPIKTSRDPGGGPSRRLRD